MVLIEPLSGSPDEVDTTIRPLLKDYLEWFAERFDVDLDIRIPDPEELMEQHHEMFRAELPNVLSRGKLLVARNGRDLIGMGAIKPVTSDIGEIKRMYVKPAAWGQGIGRAILQELLVVARSTGYGVVRLETMIFMTRALALYRSLGFSETPMFDGSEVAGSGFEQLTVCMELVVQESATERAPG